MAGLNKPEWLIEQERREQEAVERAAAKRQAALKAASKEPHSTPAERSGVGAADWWWIIRGERYAGKREAAEALNVSLKTIQRMCNGGVVNGKHRPPEKDCYVILKSTAK